MKSFDAREFIDDYEDGLIDEAGDTISENTSRLRRGKEEKFKPVGSMAQQEALLKANDYYAGTKQKKVKLKD